MNMGLILKIKNFLTYMNERSTFLLEGFDKGSLGMGHISRPNKQTGGVAVGKACLGHKLTHETGCSDDQDAALGGGRNGC